MGSRLWVDDPRFDIRRHIRARSVGPPGDEAALIRTVEELNEPPLARSRPLWELWVLTGLADGHAAMLIRLHHVVADGIAALALLGSWFDFAPDAPTPVSPDWHAAPIPAHRDLFADNLRRRSAGIARGISAFLHPVRSWGQATNAVGTPPNSVSEGLAPRSSLNGPVGPHRRLLLARADLDPVKTVAHAHGAKVNDVVLAAVSGGARELLRSRHELGPGLVLRAMVPVSERSAEDAPTGGNLVSMMTVPLPVGEADPIKRLERIAKETAERKRRLLRRWATFPTLLTALMKRQRLVNLFTSNVTGPPVSMYFAGARVLDVFQIGPIQGNVRLSVGVISYAGRLNFDMVGDADSLPDLNVFGERTCIDPAGARCGRSRW